MDDIVIYDDDDIYSSLDAVGHTSRLWDKKGNEVIIPYMIPDDASEHHVQEINKAIDEFHKKTCIK